MKDKVAVHEESEIDKTCAMEFGDDIEMESACAAGKMIDWLIDWLVDWLID